MLVADCAAFETLQNGRIYCQGLLFDWYGCDGSGSMYFRPSFSSHMQWRDTRQTSGVSHTFNETTGFGSISAQVRTFHAQLLILILNFVQRYQKEINLEHGNNNCSDGVTPNSRPTLSDQQSDERNPLINWAQCVP